MVESSLFHYCTFGSFQKFTGCLQNKHRIYMIAKAPHRVLWSNSDLWFIIMAQNQHFQCGKESTHLGNLRETSNSPSFCQYSWVAQCTRAFQVLQVELSNLVCKKSEILNKRVTDQWQNVKKEWLSLQNNGSWQVCNIGLGFSSSLKNNAEWEQDGHGLTTWGEEDISISDEKQN